MKSTSSNETGSDRTGNTSDDSPQDLPQDIKRQLAHDLRTPLSAMAGWLHVIESGTLDEAGLKKAVAKLQANIDQQVRTIERYLGNRGEEH